MKKLTTPALSTVETTSLGTSSFSVSSDIAYHDIFSTSQIEKMNNEICVRYGPITAIGTFSINNALPAGYIVNNVVLEVKVAAGTTSGTTISLGTTAATTAVINAYRWDSVAAGLYDISTSIVTLNPTVSDRNLSIVTADTAAAVPNMYLNVSLKKVITI